mmetsp:Transcript_2476/g.2914  ORF Transcript_2476/g.2914 Transcript_2476/m.2914 type:complete len:208 (+) Transcript_2476:740-1363(+)
MHLWPVHPTKELTMSCEHMATSQSCKATRWFFAPPIAMQRLLLLRHLFETSSATREEPTKDTAEISGWSQMAFTTSAQPFTRFTTPSGTPASWSSSMTRNIVLGTFSEGFRIMQLPVVMAIGSVHIGTMIGKLNGTIDATTPSGSRISWHVTPRLTSRNLPWAIAGREAAQATVSFPLAMEPYASPRFLPCSSTTKSASSSLWSMSN